MKKENIIEIEKDKYINIDTMKEASEEGIKAFKNKVQLDNQKTKERIESKLQYQNDFIDSHKKYIIELLCLEEDEFNYLKSNHDVSYLVYRFSTALFDCFDSESKDRWLRNIKAHMGKEFYYDVIEGYVFGNHDT